MPIQKETHFSSHSFYHFSLVVCASTLHVASIALYRSVVRHPFCVWCLGSATPLANSLALFHSNCSTSWVCVGPRSCHSLFYCFNYYFASSESWPLFPIYCLLFPRVIDGERTFFLRILIANWSFGVKVLDRDERNSSRRISCVIVRGRLSSGAKTTSFYGRSPFDQTIAGVLIDVLRSDFKIKFFFLRGSTPLQLSQRIDFVNRDRIVWVGSSFQEICTKFPFHPRLAVLVSSKKWNKSFCASKNACCARKNTWKYQQEGKKRAKRSNQSREKKRKINKKKIPTT